MILLDCLPNMNAATVAAKTVPIVKYCNDFHMNRPRFFSPKTRCVYVFEVGYVLGRMTKWCWWSWICRYFRANGHATTPIVLVENTHGANTGMWFVKPELASTQAMDKALLDSYNNLTKAGDKQ